MDDRSIRLFGSLSVRLADLQTPSTTRRGIPGIRNQVRERRCDECEMKSITCDYMRGMERTRGNRSGLLPIPLRYNIVVESQDMRNIAITREGGKVISPTAIRRFFS